MATELTWHDVLAEEKQQPYFVNTLHTVAGGHQPGMTIYPPQKDVSNAFHFIELGDVKVVVLGQDPYHGPGQAHDLALSVRPGITTPPPLLNMYKELEVMIPGFTCPTHGYLEGWVCRGVLLLNIVSTIHVGQAHSYASLGWETFADKVISLINQRREDVAFLFWGSHAQKKGAIINTQRYHVSKAPHPSPFSAHHSFFGCNHFVLANEWLEQRGEKPVDWTPILPVESE